MKKINLSVLIVAAAVAAASAETAENTANKKSGILPCADKTVI